MALIKRIVTGQTFGNWLDTTNKLIDDLNAANPSRGGNKLVRYDAFGSFGVRDLKANSWFLDRSSALRIDTISDTFLNPGHENDNTLFTAAATYAAIKAEAKNVTKMPPGMQHLMTILNWWVKIQVIRHSTIQHSPQIKPYLLLMMDQFYEL